MKESGVLSYITSNSWLNIGFGFEFQEYLLRNLRILSIVENHLRTFDKAEINTIITFIQKSKNLIRGNIVKFYKSLNRISDNNLLLPLVNEKNGEIPPYYQIRDIMQKNLYDRGLRRKKYVGSRWGNLFFTAPDYYFELEKHVGNQLVRLGDIAKITRGITTGINNYFILQIKSTKVNTGNILRVQNGFFDTFEIERKFLQPLISGPKTIKKPDISSISPHTFLLRIDNNLSEENLKEYKVKQYIDYGKNIDIFIPKGKQKGERIKGIQNVPSISGKARWYSVAINENCEKSDIFIQKIYSTLYKILFADKKNEKGKDSRKFICNNTFYNVVINPEFLNYKDIIKASLLSVLTYISIELNARRNFGMGALDTSTFDIENILVIDPTIVNSNQRDLLLDFYDNVANREFLELSIEFEDKFRKALDLTILKLIGLKNPENIQDEIYSSILNLTRERIQKANTFKKGKKGK